MLSWAEPSLRAACSFWTRNSRSNYNALKIFKLKPLCDFVFEAKWALDEFGRNFSTRTDISFSKHFCLLLWSRTINLWGKRTSALNFASVQISNVKHSTVLSVIYHDKMSTIERHQQFFWWDFSLNEALWPELASPWGGHHCKSLKVVKLTRGLSFSGLPFPFDER